MSYQTPFRHLRVGQVANVYGVSVPTIWRWLKDNKIPKPTKIGGSTRWLNVEIENNIKALLVKLKRCYFVLHIFEVSTTSFSTYKFSSTFYTFSDFFFTA
ncbi:helix-turn-helix domain-containing protein [Alphaproteobacteria bacterium]|nr:helix-turn-helix domain-containing protein [Alphaproteobacteria bacterium]